MSLSIHEVTTKKELKSFIKFPVKLYQNVPQYVPPIISFELSTLSKDKNPAFEHADAKYWLAMKDGEIVGRIAGIVLAQEAKEKQTVRFGWLDFIDDLDVSKLLFDTVIAWAKTKKLNNIHGPLGFTDLDFEGALVEGFDETATQATIYNYPYYINHFEQFGFQKACDWVEYRFDLFNDLDEKINRTSNFIQKRTGFHAKEFKKSKDILNYSKQVFDLLNDAYGHLYGYYALSDKQIEYFTKLYFDFVKKDFVSIIVDKEDTVVAFALTLPSLSKAFQKAKGYLFPFGFIPVLRAMKNNPLVDMFLIGVNPKMQKQGAYVLLLKDLNEAYRKANVRRVVTGPMLEENSNVTSLWSEYMKQDNSKTLRRRCFQKAF